MKVKHKFLNVLLAVCMVFSIAPATVFAADNVPAGKWTDYAATSFAGGTGSEADPYQIATAEQLAKLAKDVSEGNRYQGKFFLLTEDIDLSGHRWVPIGIYKWELGGDSTNNYFHGFIDGNNKTISNLIVDERTDKNAAGFFGNILNMNGGTVGAKDLTISNANIYAAEDGLETLQAGILAGTATANEGKQVVFENITVSGAVEIISTDGCNYVGGMIGYGSRVKATDCKAENISVTGASNSGGFVGLDVGSAYENCEVSGKVSGTWALGGFVGNTSTATLYDSTTQSVFKKCAADVEINGNDWNLGGFAGYAEYGKFDNCVALGNITSTLTTWEPHVGGFIGESDNAIVNHCHAAGKVTFSTSVYKSAGGFVGCYFGDTFENCSFDSDKNSGLTAAGVDEYWSSYILSSGVEADTSNNVLANICADYYGGHKYSTEWTIDTAATCTAEGSKSQHCEHCEAKSNITVIPASGHNLTKTEAKATTCIEEGYKAYWTCENCGKLFSDEAGKTEINAPVTIPKTKHTYSDKLTFNETGHWYATTCGHDNEEGVLDIQPHTFGSWVTVTEATENTTGLKERSCVCGYKETEEIDKLAHTTHVKDNGTRVESTCENKGSITYKCTKCGEVMEVVELDALGHNYTSQVTTEPTTESEGVRTYTCDRCGHSYTESIPKLPEETHEHSYSGSVTKEPTCTDTGVRTYTCSCGDSYTETIPALGHHYVSSVTKQPTTSSEGVMTYTCDRCRHSYTRAIEKLQDTNNNNSEDNKPADNKPGDNQQPEDNKPDTGKPYIKDETGKEGWDVIKGEVEKSKDGDTVVVEMNGSSVVPGDVLDEIKGKDVTIVFDMGGGITWSVNGQSITGGRIGDIDFSVKTGTNTIPVDVINNVTGERYSKQISLAYDGEFGFTAVLSINMDAKNAGLYANLFYYNEKTGELEFICADEIAEDGTTELTFTHASDYTIVIDTEPMGGEMEEVPDSDTNENTSDADTTESEKDYSLTSVEVSENAWNFWWIIVIGVFIMLVGFGVFLMFRKKEEEQE